MTNVSNGTETHFADSSNAFSPVKAVNLGICPGNYVIVTWEAMLVVMQEITLDWRLYLENIPWCRNLFSPANNVHVARVIIYGRDRRICSLTIDAFLDKTHQTPVDLPVVSLSACVHRITISPVGMLAFKSIMQGERARPSLVFLFGYA